MLSISEIIPASVIGAIILFTIKEAIEYKRRRKSKKYKKSAYARVLGKELKNNFSSIDSLFKIIDFINKERQGGKITFNLINLRHGYESCVISTEKSHLEMPIPFFHTKWYEKLFLDLVELEPEIAQKIEKAYDSLYFLLEKRNLITSLMAGELNSFLTMCASTAIDILPHERERIESEISDAYTALTGINKIHP